MSSHDVTSVASVTAQASAETHQCIVARSAKIQNWHLDRLAVVYVRQSSPHQVLHHRESRERQYALVNRAVALGWPRERVLTIDEDQGHTAKTSEGRSGFHRILAEVTMGHLGLVLGIEMARLARSNKDWHQLLELCAVRGTILADEDGVYDPNDSNDRLLLGLKGTISEFELVTMRNRLERGKLNKAERGELFHKLPLGYVKLATGEVILDPDEQARAVVQLLFDKFAELGTLYGLFRYLVRNKIRLGMRIQNGPQRGELAWRRPSLPTLNQVLHNPIYAGAYAYGRRPSSPRRNAAGQAQPGGRWLPPSEWKVLLRDRLPAYITWDQYMANQQQLRQNRSIPGSTGAPRQGAALLTGLLVCGSCGRRLRSSYRSKTKATYSCERHLFEDTEQVCTGLQAAPIDDLVAGQVLRAIEPAALELSLKATEDIQLERGRLHRHWKQRLERARYESQRIERQYQAVEPENRLVGRTLEQRWEEALSQQRQLEDDYDRFLREQPPQLRDDERARIKALSGDLPALWNAAATTAADRKEIVRLLVERVVVHVRPDSEYVDATIHWRGGCTTSHELVRPVLHYEQLRDYDQLLNRITVWWREGNTAAQIAEKLNNEGFRTPKKRGDYNTALVQRMLARRELQRKAIAHEQLGTDEWWLPDLADELHVPANKLRDWVVRGWVNSRKSSGQGLWIVWADTQERKRLLRLSARSKRGIVSYPASWTKPKTKR
jgi:DNA invertase Pin-like site-specific DNA recombinase